MKDRIPRKLKKKIPKGVYCYTYGKTTFDPETGYYSGYTTKPCHFYTCIKMKDIPKESEDQIMKELSVEYPEETIGWCKMLKYSIDDQCKNCSIKRNHR